MELDLREIDDDDSKNEEETNEREPDLPPEYCHYRDGGCEFADSCLKCRFPQCLYDQPGGRQRWLKELRNKEISRLFTNGDWGVNELAQLFDLSRRTIQRALKSTLSITSSTIKESEETEEIL
jgi:hypothetical protein